MKNVILRIITILAATSVIFGMFAIEDATDLTLPILSIVLGLGWLVLFFRVNDSYLVDHHEIM